ncbi:MAG: hypothetical protein ACR2H1_03565, partial [Limisphaerales bacterium]
MKLKQTGLAIAAVFLATTFHTFGVEGLTLSLQSSNAVLRWQSRTNEIFIVQYRATLDPNDFWQILTNSYPAATGTNWTTFIHSNSVCY